MFSHSISRILCPLTVALGASIAFAQATGPQPVGVVSQVKVVSNHVPDISSMDAWKRSYIKPGMSDKDKALAVFNTMVAFEVADAGPTEWLHHEDVVLDPIKVLNVYGHSYCSISAAHFAAFARAAGLKVRNVTINNHVVPEVFYDNGWHMMDADLIGYFPKADGSIASAQEMVDGISQWLKAHPEFPQGLEKKNERYKFQTGGAWRKGPEILSRSPFYDDNGWLPCTVFGWGDTMHQFAKFHFVYESGYSLGYQVNVQLRPGEKLVRNWANKGLWANMDAGGPPMSLKTKVGTGELTHSPKWGDLAPGRIGNGTLDYTVPLADGTFRATALLAQNLATKSDDNTAPAVHVKDPASSGVLEIRMPSSYVYLTGRAILSAVVPDAGQIQVLVSLNNGLDWKDVATLDKSGQQTLDLSKLILRHYDYRIRFILKGKGTGLDALQFTHDVEHSQRPLPALKQGENTITFSTGPAESTITYEASTYAAQNKGKALTYEDLHAKVINNNEPDPKVGRLFHRGSVTKDPTIVDFSVLTPQHMTRLHIFGFWRTGSPRETHWNAEVSFDNGQTFRKLTKVEAAEQFNVIDENVTDVPAGTKAAIVRYVGTGSDNGLLLNFRIDASYREPAGGFAPVQITYVWEEGGVEKKDVHVATKPNETYTIQCESTPAMKSVALELPPTAAPAP